MLKLCLTLSECTLPNEITGRNESCALFIGRAQKTTPEFASAATIGYCHVTVTIKSRFMTTSGLQTSKSAATFPRMRLAAPFGVRSILLFALLLFPVPVCAEAPLRTNEVSMVFSRCHDALRITYRNKGFIKPHWTLADLGLKPSDLDGEVTDASNYGMYVDSVSPPVVAFVYRRNFDYQAHDEHRWVSADGKPVEALNKPLPAGAGASIWPNAIHDHTAERERHEERAREEWFSLIWGLPWVLLGAALAFGILCGKNARLDHKIGAAMIFGGFAGGFYFHGELVERVYGVASEAYGDAMVASFAVAVLGGLIIRPFTWGRFGLQLLGLLPMMIVAVMIVESLGHRQWIGFATFAGCVVVAGILALIRNAVGARLKT